jgi:hypothetical protein
VDDDDSSAITHIGASPILMYKRKTKTILIMIIPMLAMEPKLPGNALALCSFISHLHHVVIFHASYFSLFGTTQTSFQFRLESKVSLRFFFVILAKCILDYSR